MNLLGKVRVLLGALVRKPFEPRREVKAEAQPASSQPAGEPDAAEQQASRPAAGSHVERSLEQGGEPPPDSERVADLIARKKRGPAG